MTEVCVALGTHLPSLNLSLLFCTIGPAVSHLLLVSNERVCKTVHKDKVGSEGQLTE